MTSFLVSLMINSVLFIAISKMMPGFEIKGETAAIKVAAIYGVLLAVAYAVLTVPLTVLTVILVGILAAVPLLGPLLVAVASLPIYLSWMLLGFTLSTFMIKMTDTVLDDFKVDGWPTALKAAGAIMVGRMGIRVLIGY